MCLWAICFVVQSNENKRDRENETQREFVSELASETDEYIYIIHKDTNHINVSHTCGCMAMLCCVVY